MKAATVPSSIASLDGEPSRLRAMLQRLRLSMAALPLAALGALLVFFISESAYRTASTSQRSLVERSMVQLQIQTLLRRIIDAETGQRGYLLTGRKEYLQPYVSAVEDVNTALGALAAHYEGETRGRALVVELSRRSTEKMSEVATSLRLFDEGKTEAWRDLLLSNIGKEKMDDVRSAADALLDLEAAAIATERERVVRTLRLGRFGVSSMAVLSLLGLFLYLRQAARLDTAQREHAQALEAERLRLEQEVAHRTADLTQLARHLQTVREDERSRLARELHDELGALLTAAKLDSARLKRQLGANYTPPVEERLRHLVASIDSGIALKRRIIEDLRPSALDKLGLVTALEILAREFAERSDLRVHHDLQAVGLSDSAQMTVYRLVQESFTNIAKHAAASELWLTLQAQGDQVRVAVRDNGRGFDTRAGQAQASHGLQGMRFRVEAEGGQLRLQSAPGQGTTVEALLPALPDADTDADARSR